MEKYQKLVSDITSGVNSYLFDQELFNKIMSSDHRTLQQNFTRMCLGWLEHCSTEEYKTDARNQATKDISKKIMDLYYKEKSKEGFYGEILDLVSKPSKSLPMI